MSSKFSLVVSSFGSADCFVFGAVDSICIDLFLVFDTWSLVLADVSIIVLFDGVDCILLLFMISFFGYMLCTGDNGLLVIFKSSDVALDLLLLFLLLFTSGDWLFDGSIFAFPIMIVDLFLLYSGVSLFTLESYI